MVSGETLNCFDMEKIDCGIFCEWEYDDDFISVLSDNLKSRHISHQVFRPADFDALLGKLRRKTLSLNSVFDRASDVDDTCEAIVELLVRRGIKIVNDPAKVRHSSDKASMHLEFITAGINVPYTMIISPYNAQHEVRLSIDQLAHLGRPFIIKPANTTGGGIGVVTGAEGLREVIDTRQHNKDDKYLLQQEIVPAILSAGGKMFYGGDGRRAWFRPFYVFGKIFICWWDDLTHLYFEASSEDIDNHNLHAIDEVVKKIYGVCGLDFFSTELAITFIEGSSAASGVNSRGKRKLVVIDYVNEMCDMRLKSKHYDGVPDNIVEQMAKQIAAGIRRTMDA